MNIPGNIGGQMQVNPGGMVGPGGMQGGVGVGMGPGVMGPGLGPNVMACPSMQGPGVMGGMGGPVNMPGPGMQAPGMLHGPSPGNPGTPHQMPPSMPQAQEKLDNISKVKSLINPLRETLSLTLKTAAQTLHQNSLIDAGSTKGVDAIVPRFDKNLEEFYSICDQIELHLKTSIECLSQGSSSARYLPLPVAPTRIEPIPNQDVGTLTYPQYLATVRTQVAYAKEIHDCLCATAQTISQND